MFIDTEKPELVLPSSFFQNYSSIGRWKIQLEITQGQVAGSSSIEFKINSLPIGGQCGINIDNGTSLSTYFEIMCKGWYDPDGKIQTYEFFGKILLFLRKFFIFFQFSLIPIIKSLIREVTIR